MQRHTATLRLDVRAESDEALHYLVDTIVERLNKKPPGVLFADVGTAQLTRAKKSRVRRVTARKR